MVLNFIKIPVLYFIGLVDLLIGYLVLFGSFFYTLLLLRQTQILFEFVCINTILSSVNITLMGRGDYLYYF